MSTDEGVALTFSEPGPAARRLGVSPSGLRRLSDAYEEVHGELPRKGGTKARLYPDEALDRLAQARMLVEAARYRSVVEALTALARGFEPNFPTEMAETGRAGIERATGEALGVVLGELRGLRAEVERLRAVVEDKDRAQLPLDSPRPAGEHGPLVRLALWLEQLLRR